MGEARLFGRASLLRRHFRRTCPIMVPSAGREAGRVTVVYLDSVFVLNGLMDYLLALCVARLAGVPLRRGRYLLAGVLGGAYAAAVFLPGLSFLAAVPAKLAAGALLALIAYGGEEKLLRLTLLFFAVSCAMAGCVLGLGLLAGGGVPMAGGVFYTDVDARVLLIAAGAAYLVLTVVFRAAARHGVRGELVMVRLCLLGRVTAFNALCDTGNSLRDPVSGAAGAGGVSGVPGRCPAPVPPEAADGRDAWSTRRQCWTAAARTATGLRPRLVPYRATGVDERAAAGSSRRLGGDRGRAVRQSAGGSVSHGTGDGIQRPMGRCGWKEKVP